MQIILPDPGIQDSVTLLELQKANLLAPREFVRWIQSRARCP